MSSIQQADTSQERKAMVAQYLERLGKLKLWSGVLGNKSLQHHIDEQQKNNAAESAFTRRKLWGDDGATTGGEDMGSTILGDVTHPTPIIINGGQQPQGSGLKTLAALALGALLPGAGIGGYLLSQAIGKGSQTVIQPVAPNPTTDTSLDIGLLKFEDLTKP